jgi:hypothetical protein
MRFLEYSGSMIRDIMDASYSIYHPSYHFILCPIGGDTLECSPYSSGACSTKPTNETVGAAAQQLAYLEGRRDLGRCVQAACSAGRHRRSAVVERPDSWYSACVSV